MDQLQLKTALLAILCAEIDERIASAQTSIDSAKEAASSETKTSSGDVYESDISLMQLEQEQYEEQLETTIELRKKLNTIIVNQVYTTVQSGSIAITSMGNYFIALSGEDIEIEGEEYTPISLRSPFGLEIKGKSKGDIVMFRNQSVIISEIF